MSSSPNNDASPSRAVPMETRHSADSEAPQKSPITVSHEDGFQIPLEHMPHGPLLLGLGVQDGWSEDFLFRPAAEGLLGRDETGEPDLESIHPPTMSHSELSGTGGTYSVPDDESHSSTIRGPLAYDYEFSWGEAGLCYGGQPLDTARGAVAGSSKLSPNSETVSRTPFPTPFRQETHFFDNSPHLWFGIGAGNLDSSASEESWAARERSLGLEIEESMNLGSDTASNAGSVSATDPQVVISLSQSIDDTVELLRHEYLKSHGPQRSQKRNNAAQDQSSEIMGCGLDDQEKAGGSAYRKPRKSKGKTVDGSGDSEDEEPHNHENGSAVIQSSQEKPRFACPFAKWKPRECFHSCKKISHMKQHLYNKHYHKYCPKCCNNLEPWEMISKNEINKEKHYCFPKRSPPLFTKEKLEAIKLREDRTISSEAQWVNIFMILFPEERQVPDPYLEKTVVIKVKKIEEWFFNKLPFAIKWVVGGSALEGLIKSQTRRILNQFLAFVLEEEEEEEEAEEEQKVFSLNELSGKLVHDDEQTTQPLHASQYPNPDTIDPNHLPITDSTANVCSPSYFTANATLDPSLIGNQPGAERIDDLTSHHTTEFIDPTVLGAHSGSWDNHLDTSSLMLGGESSNIQEIRSLSNEEEYALNLRALEVDF